MVNTLEYIQSNKIIGKFPRGILNVESLMRQMSGNIPECTQELQK